MLPWLMLQVLLEVTTWPIQVTVEWPTRTLPEICRALYQNMFKFHWRDDFNAFDNERWHKASDGFESNTSVFHPENAFTSGGHLVLKMEPELTKEEQHRV